MEISIKFKHENNHQYKNLGVGKLSKRNSSPEPKPSRTFCILEIVNRENGVNYHAEGVASCVPTDMFCKKTGRKIALTKAVKNLSTLQQELGILNYKELSTQIWEKYKSLNPNNPF